MSRSARPRPAPRHVAMPVKAELCAIAVILCQPQRAFRSLTWRGRTAQAIVDRATKAFFRHGHHRNSNESSAAASSSSLRSPAKSRAAASVKSPASLSWNTAPEPATGGAKGKQRFVTLYFQCTQSHRQRRRIVRRRQTGRSWCVLHAMCSAHRSNDGLDRLDRRATGRSSTGSAARKVEHGGFQTTGMARNRAPRLNTAGQFVQHMLRRGRAHLAGTIG